MFALFDGPIDYKIEISEYVDCLKGGITIFSRSTLAQPDQ